MVWLMVELSATLILGGQAQLLASGCPAPRPALAVRTKARQRA